MASVEFTLRPSTVAFAFRGYNVTNLGRSHEMLSHSEYGPLVREVLVEVSRASSDILSREIDLVRRVNDCTETSLSTFADSIALIMAMEMAQMRILSEQLGMETAKALFSFGYSLGEISALVFGKVFELHDALRIPLSMAEDCAALAHDVRMGVVFTRGPLLDVALVEKTCQEINLRGEGVIAVSSILAPNSVLVLGQKETVSTFRKMIQEATEGAVYVRKNQHRWPPLHTPILWEKCIPNRAGKLLHRLPCQLQSPQPMVVSLVTGKASYSGTNTRDLLNQWSDHPQRLWDAIYETLARGVETVVHVGPAPNLIPATFRRLGDNITAQLSRRNFTGLGMRAISGVARRPWLASMLPSNVALLRAPYVEHVILEDWLLERGPQAALPEAALGEAANVGTEFPASR